MKHGVLKKSVIQFFQNLLALSMLADYFCNVFLPVFLMLAAICVCKIEWKLLKYSRNVADLPFSAL